MNNFKFLIIGAGRGGTSLLAGLLDSHSRLEVGFELFSVACLMGKQIQTIDESQIIQNRTHIFYESCVQESNKYPNKFWGNKITTEQLFGLEDHNIINSDKKIDIIEHFFNQTLAGIKIIFILRDGRTCIRSKMQRTGQSFELASQRWKFSVRIYQFLKENHQDNICIKFEDLLINPTKILTDICNFLQIPFEESMLKGTNNPKILPEYRQTQFDKSKMNVIDLQEDAYKSILNELKYCNYL